MANFKEILRSWRRLWNTGEAVDSAGLNRTALGGFVALYDGWIAQQHANGTGFTPYVSGFLTPTAGLAFKGAGDRDVDVAGGIGILSKDEVGSAAGTPTAFEGPRALPIMLDDTTVTVVAHEANPRIDVIYVTVTEVDDETATRRIRQAGIGSQATDSLETRRSFVTTVNIAKGTASGSPVAPATPTGGFKIAEVDVPATSGAVTVREMRRVLRPLNVPVPWHGVGDPVEWSMGRARALSEVTFTYPGGMTIRPSGAVVTAGNSYFEVKARTLTVSAAHATNPRWDVVYVTDGTGWKIRTGTPAASPTVPTMYDYECVVALIYVPALAASITGSDVTDVQSRGHLAPKHLSRKLWTVRADVGPSGATRFLRLTSVDWENAAVSRPFVARIRVYDSLDELPSGNAGTGTGKNAITIPPTTGTCMSNGGVAVVSGEWFSSNGGIIQVDLTGTAASTHPVVIDIYRVSETQFTTHVPTSLTEPTISSIFLEVDFP